jgi:hypothetical protein
MLLAGRLDSFDDLRLPRAFRPTWPSGIAKGGVQKVDHLSRTVPTVRKIAPMIVPVRPLQVPTTL